MTIITDARRGVARISAAVTLDGSEWGTGKFLTDRNRGIGGSIPLVGNRNATYEALYRTQPAIHAGVNRIARGIGRLPWAAFTEGGQDGERERQREGPLAGLLLRPALGWTPSRFKQAVVMNLLIHGNCIAPKIRTAPGVPPFELLPSSYAYWTVVQNRETGRVSWYVFNAMNGQRIPFRPEEVMHFMPAGTGNGLEGDSPIAALRSTLMQEDAAQRMIIAAFENGLRPIGAFSVEMQLKEETARRLRQQLDDVYGGVDNAYKVMLLEGGAKYEAMTTSFVDSELSKLRQMNKEEVNSVLNIPPPAVGDLSRATFSNITEQRRMEYTDTYQPWTTIIEETFDVQLIDGEPLMQGQYVEFNYKEVLRGDPIQEIAALGTAIGGPFLTPNEGRATQNLPPLDGGDVLNPSPTTPGAPQSA